MDDRDIVRLYRSGRRKEAFDEIVRSYSERLYWHVRSFVCSHEDTDDVLQDIFMKIWAALPSFREEAQLFTWIWRIATNESLNFLRSQRLRAALSFESLADSLDRKLTASTGVDADSAQIALSRAINRLPDKQRTVFCMRYYEDLSYEDISEILDTSVGALKASYHIAAEKIKNYLKENGHTD